MANMICALVMTRKLASIIMIATAAAIMLLIVLCGPKNKATAKYNAELDEEKVVDEQPVEEIATQPEEGEEPVTEEPVAEEPVTEEVVVEEEVVEQPEVDPVEEQVEEPVVEEVIEEEPVAQEVVEEVTPVTLEEPVVEEPQQPACADAPVEEVAEEVVAVNAEPAKTKLNIPVGKKRTFAETDEKRDANCSSHPFLLHQSVSINALIRSKAVWMFSLLEAALQRMWPSPSLPNAVPGTVATRLL